MKLNYFKYIIIPKIVWWCGYGLIDNLISFWHLNIAKKKPYWEDADNVGCSRIFCRYCGKGKLRIK